LRRTGIAGRKKMLLTNNLREFPLYPPIKRSLDQARGLLQGNAREGKAIC
jgi:hypothetical protein